MTGLLAAVEAAVELVAADQEALVFQILDKTAFISKDNYAAVLWSIPYKYSLRSTAHRTCGGRRSVSYCSVSHT